MITSFSGKYEFLSNFYPVEVWLDGVLYPSVEHAFQAAKTEDLDLREKIRKVETPGKAKRLASEISLREDWHLIKVAVMAKLLDQKFSYPELKFLLIATNEEGILVEGNNWGDTFWGAVFDQASQKWQGANVLGSLLMNIRYHCILQGR